jgi:hypothetical protein
MEVSLEVDYATLIHVDLHRVQSSIARARQVVRKDRVVPSVEEGVVGAVDGDEFANKAPSFKRCAQRWSSVIRPQDLDQMHRLEIDICTSVTICISTQVQTHTKRSPQRWTHLCC